jgi:transposase-like protein
MRKIYKASDRVEVVAAVRRGEPVTKVARRLGVRTSTAYTWVHRSAKEDADERQPTFIEMVTTSATEASLRVRIGSAEIEVQPGFDSELLRAVVATLGGDA